MFDPFAVFGFEKAYALDLDVLEKRYFEDQKKTHPDRFMLSGADEKAEALKQSTALNQAYLFLKDPLKRAAFLIDVYGVEPLTHDFESLSQAMRWSERMEAGENVKPELSQEEEKLLKDLEEAFEEKNYERARKALYRLTYVQKALKQCSVNEAAHP